MKMVFSQAFFRRHNYFRGFCIFFGRRICWSELCVSQPWFFQSNFSSPLTILAMVIYSILLSFTNFIFTIIESLDFLYFIDFLLPTPLFLTPSNPYKFFSLFSFHTPLTHHGLFSPVTLSIHLAFCHHFNSIHPSTACTPLTSSNPIAPSTLWTFCISFNRVTLLTVFFVFLASNYSPYSFSIL